MFIFIYLFIYWDAYIEYTFYYGLINIEKWQNTATTLIWIYLNIFNYDIFNYLWYSNYDEYINHGAMKSLFNALLTYR